MPNWITITITDLYDAKAAALVEAADSTQLGPGQTSRTAQVMTDITNEIRAKCARAYTLDLDATAIPASLKNKAVDMIIARLKVALEQELTDAEQKNLDRIERALNRIADGKDLIEPPDNPMPAPMSQAVAQPNTGWPKLRDFRMGREDGIV